MKKILKFYGKTCGPCKVMSKKLTELPDTIEVQDIEISDEANESLVEKYGVKSIPTIIVVEDDKVVQSFSGIVPIESIMKAINE